MLFVMYGSSVFSSIFAITERSEMGMHDVPMFMSLLLEVHDVLTLSGPVELLFLLCFIAAWTYVVVSVRLVG